MAKKTWVSTNGDINTAGSWSPNGVPISGDSIYFNDSSQADVISGLGALSGINITRVWIQDSYEGNIGAYGNPWLLRVGNLIHQGSGSLFYTHQVHGSLSSFVIIDSPNLIDAFHLAGVASPGPYFYLLGGGASFSDAVTDAYQIVVSPRASANATLDIGSGLIDNYLYRQTGGIVTTKSEVGYLTNGGLIGFAMVDGGTLIVSKEATAQFHGIDIVGGRVEYNGTGTLSLGIISSGILDMSQDSREKTISTLIVLPAGMFITHDDVTVTSYNDFRPLIPITQGSLP